MRQLTYLFACVLMSSLVLGCNDDEEPKKVIDDDSYCGDFVCDDDETHETCPEDCEEEAEPFCGDGVCDPDETEESCPADCRESAGIDDDADVCVATYDFEATMAIEGTPGGMGDSEESITGSVALRYVQDTTDPQSPADGEGVEILYFFVYNNMFVEQEGLGQSVTIDTKVYGFTPDCNGTTDIEDKVNLPESCAFDVENHNVAKAIGTYVAADQEIQWSRCARPEEYSGDPKNGGYTPEHAAEGRGCLNDYHSQGNVNCEGGLCSAGGLESGDNIQDSKWNQPLETFTLSTDGSEVSVERIRLPNAQPSSTYLSFTGTQTSIDCDNTP